jgi:hypothetical protein
MIAPEFAVILVLPALIPVAMPVASIVATASEPEPHVTLLVMSFVLLSLYVPVAVNCCIVPFAIVALDGVTAMESSVGAETVVTVKAAFPLIDPDVAVMVAVPPPTPVARPVELIVAIVSAEELHVALAVRFCMLPSV